VRCSSCESLLERYVEGTLTPREMARVHEHLKRCPDCATLVTELRVVDALLATTKPIDLAPNFTFALMAEARSLPIRTRRRLSIWAALSFYTVAAWIVLTTLYVAFGDHGARLAAMRGALVSSGSEIFAALNLATHSFGASTPLVLGGVITILVIDALLALGLLALYRALRLRAHRPEAL